jgi:hypothetical protein
MTKIKTVKKAVTHEYTSGIITYKRGYNFHHLDPIIYIINSELKITDQISGDSITFAPGTKIFGDARIIHLSVLA